MTLRPQLGDHLLQPGVGALGGQIEDVQRREHLVQITVGLNSQAIHVMPDLEGVAAEARAVGQQIDLAHRRRQHVIPERHLKARHVSGIAPDIVLNAAALAPVGPHRVHPGTRDRPRLATPEGHPGGHQHQCKSVVPRPVGIDRQRQPIHQLGTTQAARFGQRCNPAPGLPGLAGLGRRVIGTNGDKGFGRVDFINRRARLEGLVAGGAGRDGIHVLRRHAGIHNQQARNIRRAGRAEGLHIRRQRGAGQQDQAPHFCLRLLHRARPVASTADA